MKIKYPVSFILMIIIMVLFAALSVVWSFAHMVLVLIGLGLLPLLRCACHREGKASF